MIDRKCVNKEYYDNTVKQIRVHVDAKMRIKEPN